MKELFHKFSARTSYLTGTGSAFVIALSVIVIWAITGPMFGFSDTWQLVINTGTTIVTFLMVFLIQNTQNRDGKAMQLKLDELIRAASGARNSLIDLEDMEDADLESLDKEFSVVHEKHPSSPLLHQLHRRISAEHQRRHGSKNRVV
jgi:low affinity Fe/Cu permease